MDDGWILVPPVLDATQRPKFQIFSGGRHMGRTAALRLAEEARTVGDTVNSMKLEVQYLCTHCGTLHDSQVMGDKCCRAETVYLCGRKGYASGVRFHFDESEAKTCARRYELGERRVAGCIER